MNAPLCVQATVVSPEPMGHMCLSRSCPLFMPVTTRDVSRLLREMLIYR